MPGINLVNVLKIRVKQNPEVVFFTSIIAYAVGFLLLDYPLTGFPDLSQLPALERMYILAWTPVLFGSWAVSVYIKRRWQDKKGATQDENERRPLWKRLLRDLSVIAVGCLILAGGVTGGTPILGRSLGGALIFTGLIFVAATPHKRGLEAGIQALKLYGLLAIIGAVVVTTTVSPESISTTEMSKMPIGVFIKSLVFTVSLFGYLASVFGIFIVAIADWRDDEPEPDEIIH